MAFPDFLKVKYGKEIVFSVINLNWANISEIEKRLLNEKILYKNSNYERENEKINEVIYEITDKVYINLSYEGSFITIYYPIEKINEVKLFLKKTKL